MKIHPKRGLLVDNVSMRIHQKCPREFPHFDRENFPFMSTRSERLELNLQKKGWATSDVY